MPTELRSRITLLLPAPTTIQQHILVDAVLTDLIRLCDGVTVSAQAPPVFDGWWFDDAAEQVKGDKNLLILADAPMTPDSAPLLAYLDGLKLWCQRDFEQDLVWLTVHLVDRITTHDPPPRG